MTAAAIELKWIPPASPEELGHYEVYEGGERVGQARQEYHRGDYYWRYTYRGASQPLTYDPDDMAGDFTFLATKWAKVSPDARPPLDDDILF